MGTRTEFDLDRHLTNWRKQFLADSTFYSEEVEELENHVRDGPVWVAPALIPVLLLFSWLFGWAAPTAGPLMLSLLLTYDALDAALGWIVGRALADRHQATATLLPA